MGFQKVEFDFPDEEESKKGDIEVEPSDAVEIDLSGKKEKKDYKEDKKEKYEV